MKYILFLLLPVIPVAAKVSDNQVVAAVIICEAGGEGPTGMQAVANVISNRATKATPFAVVTRKRQFKCIDPVVLGKSTYDEFVARASRHPRWPYALELVERMQSGQLADVTNGATSFHNPSMTPYWAAKMNFTKKIGNHLFYKS